MHYWPPRVKSGGGHGPLAPPVADPMIYSYLKLNLTNFIYHCHYSRILLTTRMFKNYTLLKMLDKYAKQIQKGQFILCPLARSRARRRARAPIENCKSKWSWFCQQKRLFNINASVQYNGPFSMEFILAFIASSSCFGKWLCEPRAIEIFIIVASIFSLASGMSICFRRGKEAEYGENRIFALQSRSLAWINECQDKCQWEWAILLYTGVNIEQS